MIIQRAIIETNTLISQKDYLKILQINLTERLVEFEIAESHAQGNPQGTLFYKIIKIKSITTN